MVEKAIKGIIFDLDGTLVNTLADLTSSMNVALASVGLPPQDQTLCRQMIGNGLKMFAQRAAGTDNPDIIDKILQKMKEHYSQHCLDQTDAYPGLKPVIQRLCQRGFRLAVLTNKNQAPAETIVEGIFGKGVFEPIVGYQDGAPLKPDPACVQAILRQWDLTAQQVVMVGDSDVDIQTANAAGLRHIIVSWGFRDKPDLLAAGAQIIVDSPCQLEHYLNGTLCSTLPK